jgi:YqaJ-like viral recombinase domain
MEAPLDDVLKQWVEYQEANGIKQQTDAWHVARVATIGGSSMATIQGINPYSSIERLIKERLGLEKFNGDIKPQWGNLFEDVIKRFVEHRLQCTIRGEDLYILGRPGTSYSPDGLAEVNRKEVLKLCVNYDDDDCRAYPAREIALMEFKCPYSRLPNGSAPKYYVPQVLMGLDLLNLPTLGIYVEGVFRRCTWDQLGINNSCDATLVPRTSGDAQGYGINGFYIDRTVLAKTSAPTLQLFGRYLENYVEYGDATNEYMCNDLGDCPVDLFTMIMAGMDRRLISVRYYPIYYTEGCEEALDADLASHTEYCRAGDHINIGILPWKIFRADFHVIDKQHNYLDKWYPLICEIVGVITICRDLPPAEQEKIISTFCGPDTEHGKASKGKRVYQRPAQPTGFSDD